MGSGCWRWRRSGRPACRSKTPAPGAAELVRLADVLGVAAERLGDPVVAGGEQVRSHHAVLAVDLALAVTLRCPAASLPTIATIGRRKRTAVSSSRPWKPNVPSPRNHAAGRTGDPGRRCGERDGRTDPAELTVQDRGEAPDPAFQRHWPSSPPSIATLAPSSRRSQTSVVRRSGWIGTSSVRSNVESRRRPSCCAASSSSRQLEVQGRAGRLEG